MASSVLRIKKSRSMMLSLYSLSGLAALLLFTFVAVLWGSAMIQASEGGSPGWSTWPLLQQSLWLVTTALLVIFPVACSLTYVAVVWGSTRWAPRLSQLLQFIWKAPVLITGVVFLFVCGPTVWGLSLTLAMVGVIELTRRWLSVTELVAVVEIESLQAIGLDIVQIIYVLYVKRYFNLFLGHLLATACSLFVLMTPLLCFVLPLPATEHPLPLALYKTIFESPGQGGGIALILLLVHGLRVALDHQNGFWEVEFG